MIVKKYLSWQILLLILILLKSFASNSAEIQSFGYLGYEGQLGYDYVSDDNFSGTDIVGGDSTNEERIIKQESLNLLFHSFIYHPNFVKFDFGFGIVGTQSAVQSFEVTQNSETSPPELISDVVSLDSKFRLSFFEKKDYPFSLFYENKHPGLSVTATDAFISENTRYGAKFLWNAPVIFNVNVIHFETKGDSNLRIINNKVDSTTFRAYKALDNSSYQQINAIHQVTKSASGDKRKIIVSSNINDSVNYDSQYYLGKQNQYDFNLKVAYQRNRGDIEFDDISVSPKLRWKHSAYLSSYYQYSYQINQFAEFKSVSHSGNGGLLYANDDGITNSTSVSANRVSLKNAVTQYYNVSNNSSYKTNFDGGSFSVSGGLTAGQNQTLTNLTSLSIKEFVILNRNTFVTLNQNNVVGLIKVFPGSNTAAKAYSPITDYEVRNIAGVVSIKLRPNTTISDGEKVLVEYSYDPGGDNTFQTLIKTLSSRLQFYEYFNVYGNYTDFKISTIEGKVSQNQVTDRITTIAGAGFDFPLFADRMLIGGKVKQEKIEDNIISTLSVAQSVYTQFQLFRTGSLHLSRQHATTEYVGANVGNNDVNRVSYFAVFKFRPLNRTNLSLIYEDSVDVGSIVVRSFTESSLRFEWHYRKLLLNLTASLLKDKQGDQLRKRAAIHLNLIRTF